ncbi:hypothetical protein [Desulfosarcina ovata]|uniref:hypothetical protein n=1 Tax=Desulfosarcina ovata TaxID=83564 RepID=UPI0012D2F74E|nr:hypothetical protein [Desulfosarcina ovata]
MRPKATDLVLFEDIATGKLPIPEHIENTEKIPPMVGFFCWRRNHPVHLKQTKKAAAIVIMRFRFVPAWQFDQFFEKFSSGYDQKVQQNCTQLASR